MATKEEHFKQFEKNIKFLADINKSHNTHWDWQITVLFYSALHLVNCHVVITANMHFRTHGQVDMAINPFGKIKKSAFPEVPYTAYQKLKNLSRRSRYLIHEDENNKANCGYFTYDKHFAKAVRHFEVIANHLKSLHDFEYSPLDLSCLELNEKGQYGVQI